MSLHLTNYKPHIRTAIKFFWAQRETARQRQRISGKIDQGERAGVTAGKNMNGFLDLLKRVVVKNGLKSADIQIARRLLTLPGYFRPTKIWDMLVIRDSKLIAAIELKSQVGPSFGNNFNNRCEEALGSATDLWTAYREGAFGEGPAPFLGWLMLLEDCEASRSSVKDISPNFPVFPEFKQASYAQRYALLCQKLMREKLYTSAALLLSPVHASETGAYTELSETSGIKNFLISFASHIAAAAAAARQ